MRLSLFLIIISSTLQVAWSINCDRLLRELANGQSKFVYCNTQHAVPAHPQDDRLCNSCKVYYDEMANNYENLMKIENCSKMYMDSDRMNIVFTTQNMLKGLWERAYCDECFKDNNSKNFNDLYMNLSTCLESHKSKECISCQLMYTNMNEFFKELDQRNNGKMCFDMQDMMNRTRVQWSKDLKCCQREVKMNIFLTSVAVVAILPILLFYTAALVLTKRREHNHGLLNEHEPELDSPSTSQLITAAILSTPTAIIDAKTEQNAQIHFTPDSELSSDDEQIVKAMT